MLATFGSLAAAMEASTGDLDAVLPGLGPVAAAARDLGIELARDRIRGGPVQTADPKLHDYLKRWIGGRPRETMIAVFVDRHGGYICDEEIGTGEGDTVQVRFRTIFRRALALSAPAVLLAHNHPSGQARPSPADGSAARALAQVAAMLGVAVIDNLIVTHRAIYSMAKGAVL